jgi:hypothetical protein
LDRDITREVTGKFFGLFQKTWVTAIEIFQILL